MDNKSGVPEVLQLQNEFKNKIEQHIKFQKEILDKDKRDPFIITFLGSNDEIFGFEARGATGFFQYGYDIIAASVSSLSINTANSIRFFTDDEPEIEMSNNYLKCVINNRVSKESKLLLKSLKLGMRSIQDSYGEKYVQIEKFHSKRNKRFFRLFN